MRERKRAATARDVKRELAQAGNAERAASSVWFFKTGKGEYGEGDRFLGVPVPVERRIALRHRNLPLEDIARLLASPIHEHRFTALEILVDQYEQSGEKERERIVEFYLAHTSRINNWDLVDTSAPYILGEHLRTRPRELTRDLLDRLAASESLWERRIAIVATFAFIRAGEIADTLRISEKLLADKQDLIQKAVGWALRESGKVSDRALLKFLRKHYPKLPRTTLRYAIERFPPDQRTRMLAGEFPRV